jgi:hypothetical protein
MTAQETELWQKIENFEPVAPNADFKFSARLARENGWSMGYAKRVIAEYKKFIFLCCITEHGVTPSDAVDQAWHLHLTFTRSYWVDLCQNTINKQLHHNPTKGGKKEAEKFDSFYTSSHQLYQQYFVEPPPADIWHNNQTRFTDINFQRINMRKYWVVKKPRLSAWLFVLVAVFIICTSFIQISDTVVAVVVMLTICIGAVVGVYHWESNPNRSSNKKDRESGNGCTSSDGGCSAQHSGHHHGSHDNGGDSGCSGCSSSGCSGCGGD